jgi:glycosyltransferase involved in cell wall biosynthesis
MKNNNIPEVSVIIATKNSAQTIHRCMKSLSLSINSFLPNEAEVIFVDYNSTDDTLKMIKHFPNSILVKAKKRGIAHAHNLGVKQSKGRYICFLNSDDEHTEFFIQRLYGAISKQKDGPAVAYSTVRFIDEDGARLYDRYPAPYFEWMHKHSSVILHPNAMYPSELMKKHKFAELENNTPSDREQVLDLMRHARPVRVKEAIYNFRIWGNSETVRRARDLKQDQPFFAKFNELIARTYIHAFESHKVRRLFYKLVGKSFWTGMN